MLNGLQRMRLEANQSFWQESIEGVIKAGATTINLPDTVGYTTPDEYYEFLMKVQETGSFLGKGDDFDPLS